MYLARILFELVCACFFFLFVCLKIKSSIHPLSQLDSSQPLTIGILKSQGITQWAKSPKKQSVGVYFFFAFGNFAHWEIIVSVHIRVIKI